MKGRPFDFSQLEHLSDVLIYRNSLIKLATEYKAFLGLEFPDCAMYDVEAWKNRYYSEEDETGQIAREKIGRFHRR